MKKNNLHSAINMGICDTSQFIYHQFSSKCFPKSSEIKRSAENSNIKSSDPQVRQLSVLVL